MCKIDKRIDERFKVTSVSFFIPDFNLLNWELDNFTLKLLYWVILYWYYIKAKQICNTLTVPCKKSKIVSFASSVMKRIVTSWSRFPVKLICCIAFGSASSAFCLLKSIAIVL